MQANFNIALPLVNVTYSGLKILPSRKFESILTLNTNSTAPNDMHNCRCLVKYMVTGV